MQVPSFAISLIHYCLVTIISCIYIATTKSLQHCTLENGHINQALMQKTFMLEWTNINPLDCMLLHVMYAFQAGKLFKYLSVHYR